MRLSILFGLALTAAPAFAQEAPLDKLYACAGVGDSAARLSCYDTAVAGLKQAQGGGDVAVVSRSQIEKAEKEAFGLPTPTLSALAASAQASSTPLAALATPKAPAAAATPPAPKPPQPLDRVTLAVKSVDKAGDGTLRFTMANGQVWRQTDSAKLPSIGQGPWTAEIRKAAIGSFMLKLDDRTAVRVKRVD
jgi:hypothetical protein